MLTLMRRLNPNQFGVVKRGLVGPSGAQSGTDTVLEAADGPNKIAKGEPTVLIGG